MELVDIIDDILQKYLTARICSLNKKIPMAGQYIMRKFGRLGLLTGTQPFYPTQFHRFVSFFHCHCISSLWLLHSKGVRGGQWLFAVTAKLSNLIVVGFLELKHYPKQFWDDGAEINEGSNIIGIYPGTNYGTRSTIVIIIFIRITP